MSTLKVDSILNTAGVDNRGKVVQFVTSSPQLARPTTTSTSFVDTGFGINITPKYSNSLIVVCSMFIVYINNGYVWVDLRRDGTQILTDPGGNIGTGYHGSGHWDTSTIMVKDTPNTTSQLEYNLYFKSHNGNTVYLGNTGTVPTGSQSNCIHFYAFEVAQ